MPEASIPTISGTRTSAVAVKKTSFSRSPRAATVVLVIIVLILAGFGGWFFYQNRLSGLAKDWQAVFLSNGQVYFGHVKKQNNHELLLEDIYYLQVVRPLQQGESSESSNEQGQLTLVKLGNELHKPTDRMYINRDHVLFMEDLKEDSNVVQAIINYKNGQ